MDNVGKILVELLPIKLDDETGYVDRIQRGLFDIELCKYNRLAYIQCKPNDYVKQLLNCKNIISYADARNRHIIYFRKDSGMTKGSIYSYLYGLHKDLKPLTYTLYVQMYETYKKKHPWQSTFDAISLPKDLSNIILSYYGYEEAINHEHEQVMKVYVASLLIRELKYLQNDAISNPLFDRTMSTLSIHQKIQSCLDYCQISYDNELLETIINMMDNFFQ
jgi:hypothetical protein